MWHDAVKDQPFLGREILIFHDGKVRYGIYLGDALRAYGWERGRYVYEQISLVGDMAQSYAVMSNFSDGDKWAYMEDFVPDSSINNRNN